MQQQHHTDEHPPPRSRQYVPKLLHMLDASQKPAVQAHLQEKSRIVVKRPPEVQDNRMKLPICALEQEVVNIMSHFSST